MNHIYWIKFHFSEEPKKFAWKTIEDMLKELPRLILDLGWIEWMQRK